LFLIKLYFLWLGAISQDIILCVTLCIQEAQGRKKKKKRERKKKTKMENKKGISPVSLFPENNFIAKLCLEKSCK